MSIQTVLETKRQNKIYIYNVYVRVICNNIDFLMFQSKILVGHRN